MSISGVGSVGAASRIGTIAAAQAAAAPARQAHDHAGGADASPSAFFDMTSWTGATEASVTTGPAAARASLPELSASVLSAILR